MTASEIDHVLDHHAVKKSRRRWRWTAIILALAGIAVIGIPVFKEYFKGEHIARLRIDGLITGDQARLDLLSAIAKNDDAKALIIRIDSPGGTTVGSEALYEAIRDVGKKKPVVAVMDTVAASGGYITALAADRIVARNNTITGSIGVIFTFPEVSRLLDTIGVRIEEVKSGDLKAEPSPYKPVSDKARLLSLSMVQDGFDWFKGLVSERRKLAASRTAVLADGRVFTGRQAMAEGLIDAIGDEDDAIDWLETEKNVQKDLPVLGWDPEREIVGGLFGTSLIKAFVAETGLDGLKPVAARAKLDGMLVLWHP